MRVFVYGSLKKEGQAHTKLGANVKFIGSAEAMGCLYKLRGSWFPAAKFGGPGKIVGEVYDIDDDRQRALDAFEGHPNLFQRKTIVLPAPFDVCTVYHFVPPVPETAELIESGIWPVGATK